IGLGSACSSHKQRVSRVLSSMGISGQRAESALRFSLSPLNTMEEMDETADAIREIVEKLREMVGYRG
ncbi:MAG: cysteine desulfurase NifS, partial [Lachnospiraceae bacterium]|nr:cysteine desulfurase NifS [Lachnospiraceae bacterium]